MATLVDSILSIEQEADALLSDAERRSNEVKREAEAALSAYRQELSEESDRRVAAFRKDAEERHKKDIAQAEAELKSGLEAVDKVSGESLQQQVNAIVSHFRGL